ncbi:MAG: hypothetical protein Kow0068_19280 [Marinilabiliales bacterium]
MNKTISKILFWVIIYSIAMAFLESSVVIYLRKLYYPEGFNFPLKIMHKDIIVTEFLRELATLIMLVSISCIAAKTFIERFAYFIISFAIWDIFYYVFLWLLLGWPRSLFTWDILFLIPVTWTGPVISPVICSFLMILLGLIILLLKNKTNNKLKFIEWFFLLAGSITVIISFIYDYLIFLRKFYTWKQIIFYDWYKNSPALAESYIPEHFPWFIFIAGITIIVFGIMFYLLRMKRQLKAR